MCYKQRERKVSKPTACHRNSNLEMAVTMEENVLKTTERKRLRGINYGNHTHPFDRGLEKSIGRMFSTSAQPLGSHCLRIPAP